MNNLSKPCKLLQSLAQVKISSAQKKSILILFFLLAIPSIILILGISPAESNFEGVLNVDHIAFTLGTKDVQKDRILLNNIPGIHRLTILGLPSISLNGRVNGNSKLLTLNKIKNDQEDPEVTLKAEENKDLSIVRLNVPSGTIVSELKISKKIVDNKSEETLTLKLSNSSCEENSEDPKKNKNLGITSSLPENNQNSSACTLSLSLGQKPIGLFLKGYELRSGILKNNKYEQETNPNWDIKISKNIMIEVDLPELLEATSSDWVWAKGDVHNVSFFTTIQSSSTGDKSNEEAYVSSILEGKISGFSSSQSLTEWNITEHQFLVFQNIPYISDQDSLRAEQLQAKQLYITSLGINSLKNNPSRKVLTVYFSGKTDTLSIGVQPRYPVLVQKSSILQNMLAPLPKEFFIYILTGALGLIGSFLIQVFVVSFPPTTDKKSLPDEGASQETEKKVS